MIKNQKGGIMKEQIQIAGLCVNCLNADQCGYRVNHTKPIIFCEEFTCADPSESRNKITRAVKHVVKYFL